MLMIYYVPQAEDKVDKSGKFAAEYLNEHLSHAKMWLLLYNPVNVWGIGGTFACGATWKNFIEQYLFCFLKYKLAIEELCTVSINNEKTALRLF